jgi:hypothetical protein
VGRQGIDRRRGELRLRRALKEPLVHFLIGGALLFALDAWLGSSADQPSYELHVGAGQIERLSQAWQAQSGRVPTDAELDALVEDHVREEIYYREAVRRGLDQGDVLVRRRLAQKLAFLVEDLAEVEDPREEELRRFFTEHGERYVEPAELSFRHLFFSRDRRADPASDAAAALGALASGARPIGDPFMLHSEYAGRTHQEVRELFGVDFADAVFALEGAEWQGPVRSSYGEHLVQVIARAEARMPAFEEARAAVERDFGQARREQANEAAYREMRSRYQVVVEESGAEQAKRDHADESAG